MNILTIAIQELIPKKNRVSMSVCAIFAVLIATTLGCGQIPEEDDRPPHVKQGNTWEKVIFQSDGLVQPIVDKKNTIYIGGTSGHGKIGNAFALNSDGSIKWQNDI
jgi:outer membrane protein assembly factor BamB